jgi:DNA primase catalytic core
MTQITPELKDRIKDASNIIDVIGQYTTLRKRGVNYVGCCPFHDEKTSSFTVSPTKNIYKCFGCGKSGDVISFIQDHEHISYPETIKVLAKRANIEVPEQEMTDEERRRMNDRESLRTAVNAAHAHYKNKLTSTPEAMKYLAGRDIEPELIGTFGLGYSENANEITAMASKGGFNTAPFLKLGLIKKGDHGMFDAFRQRIMYPFYDLSGNVCGFTGRHTDWKKGDPFGKFSNSDDSDLFHKERLVYGLFQAKKCIVERDKAYLVEGQHDVLSLVQRSVRNTVGGSGTAFSTYQAKQILRFTNNVTVMYDGDSAGLKATLAALTVLLTEGANVRIIRLAETEDPDSFARKTETEKLAMTLSAMETDVVDFHYGQNKEAITDIYKKETAVTELCGLLSLIPNDSVRKEMLKKTAELYKMGMDQLAPKVMVKADPTPSVWKDGFYGIDEAKTIAKHGGTIFLTFNEQTFIKNYESKPYVYARGRVGKDQVQYFRTQVKECTLECSENHIEFSEDKEQPELELLINLFRQNVELEIEICSKKEDDDNAYMQGFVDYYVSGYGAIIAMLQITENTKVKFIERCAEIISCTSEATRAVQMKSYAKSLMIGQSDLKAVVTPYLNKRKDKATLESKRLDTESELLEFDPEKVPSYVLNDKNMLQVYNRDRFYPLMNKESLPVSYMFRNEKGGGHTCISDFYLKPLLHIENKDSVLNKRVIQLNHMHLKPRYVEWQSSFMANLGKLNEKFIEEGSYNFDGTLNQWKTIWRNMSYQFTACSELRTFGQQPEEFWAWTNAILHEVEGETKIEYTDHLGVATHNGKNYYSPAFSEIFNTQRRDGDQYELDRHFVYKEIAPEMNLSFEQWADMMNEVYKINNNGKWAVLFSVLSCFRDYIFSKTRRFTTLFLIGPTGSGKSQVAFSMRSLFMSPTAPVFNLNQGTDAAFFMLLERNENVLTIMEEYNDTGISQPKFQGLKSAVLDGQGKTKVKDMNSKTLDSSKINAVPLILGQEAPQQDDGSLSNRVILCDVPYNPNGEFTQEEKDLFNRLKSYEIAGLCNVLVEVLSLRSIVKANYITILTAEIKKINAAIRANITNSEGLDRVIESVAMVVTMCKLIEQETGLKLPFTYEQFFPIACDKVLKIMETISTSSKQSTYFNTISFLINQGSLKIGKELKVVAPAKVTVMRAGKETEVVNLEPVETKVLYIDFEAIYPLYTRSVKDAMTRASLKSYFASNKAYIGLCKSTHFRWSEEKSVPREVLHDDGTKSFAVDRIMEKKNNNTSAYMFNYDILKDLMNVDFERVEEEEQEQPLAPKGGQDTSTNEYKPTKEGDLPF